MSTIPRTARSLGLATLSAAVVLCFAPAAAAAPGDWTNLSGLTSASAYPAISTIDAPTQAWFGTSVQVLWPQQVSGSQDGYATAVLDAGGRVTTPTTGVIGPWQTLTSNPTLVSLGGQRFVSFSGLNPGRSGAQYFATAPDATSFTVADGSMSETQNAYAEYGSDAVDDGGTPVWVGNPGTTTGVTWHVGTSSSSPAPAGSDQRYLLTGCCAYNAAGARDASTGAVYAAFYSNSDATSENGIHVGRILPASGDWRQAPGSTTVSDGRASSVDPGQRVAMVGRPGGGVFVAYGMGYPSVTSIRILDVVTGATIDVPRTKDARAIALSAEPDGRLWLTWRQGTSLRAVHTNAAGTRLGAVGTWRSPRGTESIWKSSIAGTAGGASVVITATTQNAINVWQTMVARTLSVSAKPAVVGRGGSVTFTVTDAGDPVAGAKVTFAGRSGTTNAAGKVTVKAPGARGAYRATAMTSRYRPGAVRVRVG